MPASTVKGKLVVGDVTFEYCETKSSNAGGGPRGIDIWVKGVKGRTSYDITPNPHDNSKHYPKKSVAFYAALATAIAARYAGEKFPKSVSNISWQGESYKCE